MAAAASSRSAPRVLLAGGGSGGHVFPALAVGGELARRGWEVEYAGAAEGMEARLVAERGLTFHPLPARALVGRGPVDQVRALWVLARSTLAARALVRRLGTRVVVGTGGYVSAPAVLGASLASVPSLLVEPNAKAGLANRWLSRWAADAAVAFEGASASLRCAATVTGVPVRAAFAALPAAAEVAAGRPVHLLVLGGSQGSEQLNREVPAALGRLAAGGPPPASVLHQAGRGKVPAAVEAYAAAGVPVGERVRVVDFIADTAVAMGDADLVISRAGAITSAELCAAGRASLLVPLAAAAGGHQLDNAAALAAAGAAVVVSGDRLTAGELAQVLGELLADPPRLAAMARAARGLGRPDAAAAIADLVEGLAGAAGSGLSNRPSREVRA
jgi:UDP-N-acetylglucosamine--N-acetylmuramyl-(pentapeptide) pyrophosphoryl-undecaprenol N-acetylglucosamine transferase